MRDFISTNSFNSVAAGQTATIDLPVGGLTYHQCRIRYGTGTAGGASQANMESEITAVRIKVDGKVQRRFSAVELFAINAFNGIAFQTGELPIFFSEPWRRSAQGEDALAWGTADIGTFQIEVDLAAGATAPTLEAYLEVERVSRPMGAIVKWRRYNVPVSAAGVVNVTTLPKIDAYYRLHAHTGNVSDVEILVDQLQRYKASAARNTAILQDYGKSPQAGWFHVAFDRTDRVADALAMRGAQRAVSEYRIDFNMSAAGSFDLITETLGPRD
jgi:hypothetical protein